MTDQRISSQAFREAADTLAALIDKLPTLDVTWTPEIQADWFKAFDVLMEKVRGHLLAAAEQREALDAMHVAVATYKSIAKSAEEMAALRLQNVQEGERLYQAVYAELTVCQAERDALTAANQSLDAHCMVLQHDIRTALAELDEARHERELMRVKLARATYQADTQ